MQHAGVELVPPVVNPVRDVVENDLSSVLECLCVCVP